MSETNKTGERSSLSVRIDDAYIALTSMFHQITGWWYTLESATLRCSALNVSGTYSKHYTKTTVDNYNTHGHISVCCSWPSCHLGGCHMWWSVILRPQVGGMVYPLNHNTILSRLVVMSTLCVGADTSQNWCSTMSVWSNGRYWC